MGKELGKSILIDLISLNIIGLTAPIYLWIWRQVNFVIANFSVAISSMMVYIKLGYFRIMSF